MDPRVRDRIIAETRGNPLALLELPHAWTTAELADGFEQSDPLVGAIEEGFVRRLCRTRRVHLRPSLALQ
jgi:hypothetical protein